MHSSRFFMVAIALALVALPFHVASRNNGIQGSFLFGNSWNKIDPVKHEMRAEADRLENRAFCFCLIGGAFAVSGLACLVIAFVRKARGWYSIPAFLLLIDLLTQSLL